MAALMRCRLSCSNPVVDQGPGGVGRVAVAPLVGSNGIAELARTDSVEGEPGEADQIVVWQRHGQIELGARLDLGSFHDALDHGRSLGSAAGVEREPPRDFLVPHHGMRCVHILTTEVPQSD